MPSKSMAADYLRLPYTRRVRPERGTRGESLFVASVDELPGCQSHGATADEALQWLEDAMAIYIGLLLDDGLEPPVPAGSAGEEAEAVSRGP